MIDLLDRYLDEIGRTPLFTADEERQLAQAIERASNGQSTPCAETSPGAHERPHASTPHTGRTPP